MNNEEWSLEDLDKPEKTVDKEALLTDWVKLLHIVIVVIKITLTAMCVTVFSIFHFVEWFSIYR